MKKTFIAKKMSFLLVVMLIAAMAFGCGKKAETTVSAPETETVSEAADTQAEESEAAEAADTEAADAEAAPEPDTEVAVTVLGDTEAAYMFRLAVTDADENTLCYEVYTDEANVGAALYALEVIDDPSFFSTVNGMTADWDADEAYWAVYENGEYASVGVGEMELNADETLNLSFVYTVGF